MKKVKPLIAPDTSSIDYKYGIFAKMAIPYGGPSSKYWSNKMIRVWMDNNNVSYEDTDKRVDLIQKIKDAGYK